MEWLIIIAGAALGILPLAKEVGDSWSEHAEARRRQAEAEAKARHEAAHHVISEREVRLLQELASPGVTPFRLAQIEAELDMIQMERLQLEGRPLLEQRTR